MTRIEGSMNSTIADETITFRTEHGETITAHIVASQDGETIANCDRGDRWMAITITDYGDGRAEYDEFEEGTTFDVDLRGEFVVRRTDNAGSLKWALAD